MHWAFQLKMSFRPDISKQTLELIISGERTIISHLSLTFNDIPVAQTCSQKHLEMILDNKLNFEEHLHKVVLKVDKTIDVICKLQNILSRPALLRIYKSLSGPIYIKVSLYLTKPSMILFTSKLESLQYNAVRNTSK